MNGDCPTGAGVVRPIAPVAQPPSGRCTSLPAQTRGDGAAAPPPRFSLRDYQVRDKGRIRAEFGAGARSVLYVLPTGGGKCLGRGTPVLKYDGSVVPVENVRQGDLLIGPDGRPREVQSTCRGREMLYRVTPTKGDPYVVNESHILSLKNTNTGKIVNLSVNEWLNASKTFRHTHKGWRAPAEFGGASDQFLLLEPYFLGVWLGDGSSRRPSISTGDEEIKSYVLDYAQRLGGSVRIEPNSPNSQNLHIRDDGSRGHGGGKLGNALRHYRLIQNKHIPHAYKCGSRDTRLQVLAGIIDTDGHWSGKGFDLSLKSERLMDDVVFVARSLGFAAYKRPSRKTCYNTGAVGNYWRCVISGPVDEVPCKIPRKVAPPRRQKKDVLRTGISVERVGPGDYFGFTLAGPDRLFLLGDFTVTHNTIVFASIVYDAVARGRRVLILVHRRQLVDQIRAKLGPLPGVLVSTVQSVSRRLHLLRGFDFIITDEAHHALATTYLTVYAAFPAAKHLGVTATPWRMDGSGLGDVFDVMVVGPSMRELIRDGYLCDYEYFAPDSKFDRAGIPRRGGDFIRSAAAERANKPTITGSMIELYKQHSPGALTMVFCASVEHAHDVAEACNRADIPAAALDGSMDDRERNEILDAYERREIRALTSVDLVGEGFDLPAIETIHELRPTESLVIHMQHWGRGLRPSPGKDRALLFDHVGNWEVPGLGLPCQDREWSLASLPRRKRGDSEPVEVLAVRRCPACVRISPAWLAQCQYCGEPWPVESRKVDEVEGRLSKVDKAKVDEQRAMLAAMSFGEAQAWATEPSGLRIVAEARGYKPGWALRQAIKRFDLDPFKACAALGYKPGLAIRLGLAKPKKTAS